LHPGTPKGGVPLSSLFRGANLPALHARTKAFAATFGVTDFQPQDWLHNTRRALASAEFARDEGRLDPFRAAAFAACFRQGLDIENDETLGKMAEAAGLPSDAVIRAADDAKYLDRVDARQAQARKVGVTGIPTFVLGDRRAVGCQPYERLEQELGLST
jgi:predicted DsbA family dithiol-disulfide isomerase